MTDIPTWSPYITCAIWVVVAIAGPHTPGLKGLFGRRWNWFENLAVIMAVASLSQTWIMDKLNYGALVAPAIVYNLIYALIEQIGNATGWWSL